MILKIYGERNTGTNYLEKLLLKHAATLSLQKQKEIKIVPSHILLSHEEDLKQFGWKHRLIDKNFLKQCGIEQQTTLIVTITKNPYSWLLSLHQRPYAPIHLRSRVIALNEQGQPFPHSDRNIGIIRKARKYGRLGRLFLSRYPQWSEYEEIVFSDFIRAKWFTQFNEGCDQDFKNPIKLWNVKNKAYIELAKHFNVLSFTYEDLLNSPEIVIQKIFTHLGVNLEKFENIVGAVKHEDESVREYVFDREYYLGERWQERLKKRDTRWISSQLDQEVMREFGYKFLDN